ncbi:MAG: alpha/beta fold hydrolase [Kiloniellales bacterium]
MNSLLAWEPIIKTVELPNGPRLRYVEQGDPVGVPVVLLHGYSDSWRSFERVLPLLPSSIRAIAVTQRGHGDSGRPESGYRPTDFAADLAAVLDHLGTESAIVAGHSMGATVAQRFAVDYPERCDGLLLIGAFAAWRDNAALVEFWHEAIAGLGDPIHPAFVREFQESTLAKPVPPAFLDRIVRESLKVPARVWKAAYQAFLEDDTASRLTEIAAPTLIVWGERDAFCPQRDQETLAGSIPDARLVIYPGAGHGLHWELPMQFVVELLNFVAERAMAVRGAA